MAAHHFNNSNIDFWIKNELNVLLRGKHGVGKTARILEAFKRNNIRFQYFSASTMDPWVDFIGVPKEKTDPTTGQAYLDLVRPKVWQDDAVEAIFLDEFNRSSKKVRNAVMELIQFKSINGRKFNNLKIIWAAINPEEEEEAGKYDVEALDPAQMDRFHVIVNVPYAPDAEYFRKKFGRDQADIALQWWKETLKDDERNKVSPRRLDYLIDVFNKGGDLKPLVHQSINLQPLTVQLKNGPISKQIEELYESKNVKGARNFLFDENNYNNSIATIIKKTQYMDFFVPLLGEEQLFSLMNQHKNVEQYVWSNYPTFKQSIHSLASARSGQLSQRAHAVVMQNVNVNDITTQDAWKSNSSESTLKNKLASLKSVDIKNTSNREMVYRTLVDYLPENFSPETAAEVLQYVEVLILKSTKDTILARLPELPKMFAHVVKSLERNGIDWKGLGVDSKTIVHKLNEVDVFVKSQRAITNRTSQNNDTAF